MDLSASTWTDADDCDADVALLPVGATEQHGPHAPLGTDAMSATAVAAAGADAYDGEAVVAPTVPVGVSAEHRQFTGTLWVSPDTFRAYVRETAASLASHGWDRVVVVNGHGGNVDAIREVAAALTREEVAYTVPFTWFEAVDAGEIADAAMGHGGAVETSLVAHLDPELVREERLEAAAAGAAESWGESVRGSPLAYDSASFSENGTVGDPRGADPETGQALLDAAADALAAVCEAVAARDPAPPPHR